MDSREVRVDRTQERVGDREREAFCMGCLHFVIGEHVQLAMGELLGALLGAAESPPGSAAELWSFFW